MRDTDYNRVTRYRLNDLSTHECADCGVLSDGYEHFAFCSIEGCSSQLCGNCDEVKCGLCSEIVCEQHRTERNAEIICHRCLAVLVLAAVEEAGVI